ncbi:hypothetical protein [Bacillus stratosphericus]|uniref:hypothetical protein n=1 Tax=Bacillus stratosphericus TaxID=293386 RepID=UPI001CFA9871|nr:hypothetical protein [Bacillus stratosphericus]
MKNIIIKTTVVVLFFISIFVNIVLAANLSDANEKKKQMNEKVTAMEHEMEKKEGELTNYESKVTEKELTEDPANKRLLENFFQVQYQYNEKSYKDRFTKIKKYVNKNVYGQLTAAGIPDTPKIKFENVIKDMQIFLTPSAEQNVTGMVLLKTQYKIENVKNPTMTQIFKVEIQDKQIAKLETVGTVGESISES